MKFEDLGVGADVSRPRLETEVNRRILYDRDYVIDQCDFLLNDTAIRRFCPKGLRGDRNIRPGSILAVHGYYPRYNLAVNYHGRQYSKPHRPIDERMTVSNVSRGEQRAKYSMMKSAALKEAGIIEIIFHYKMFSPNGLKINRRPIKDQLMIREVLSERIPNLCFE